MDTTQKTREEAAQRRPRQEAPKSAQKRPQSAKKPRPTASEPVKRRPAQQDAAPPASAQQNNGAARTAEEQRAATPKQRPVQAEPRKKQAAPKPKREEPKKAAKPKQTAVRPKRTAPKADPDDISAKKRAYGKSKPKKKSAIEVIADVFKQTAEKNAAKKTRKNKSNRPKQPTPAVIYTQPQAFNRNRLFVQLLTVTAIVVALVLGVSVFFKVEHLTISGAEVYSEWAIKEASGLKGGENLLTFSRPRAGALIKANLPYVDTVRFGIKLPDTVTIIVKEDDVVYAIKDQDGAWWLMNSDGRVVEMANNSKAANYTQVLGVTLDHPVQDEKGVATESMPTETDPSGETVIVPVTVTGAQRLNAALQILKALEANDIVGDAASVDVSRIEDIILWYGTRYQVNLGDSSRLDYKIDCMNDVILQMSDYQSGILDISFTIWPNQVGYTPFA